MQIALRLALTCVLVAVAAFCGFGFLATFEPPGYPVLRGFYATAAVSCVAAIAAAWLTKASRF